MKNIKITIKALVLSMVCVVALNAGKGDLLAELKTQLVHDFLAERQLNQLEQEYKDYVKTKEQEPDDEVFTDVGEFMTAMELVNHVQQALDAQIAGYNREHAESPLSEELLQKRRGIDQTIRNLKQMLSDITQRGGSAHILALVRENQVDIFDRFVKISNELSDLRTHLAASALSKKEHRCAQENTTLAQQHQECIRERTVLSQHKADLTKKETGCSDELAQLKRLNARYEDDIRRMSQELKELRGEI